MYLNGGRPTVSLGKPGSGRQARKSSLGGRAQCKPAVQVLWSASLGEPSDKACCRWVRFLTPPCPGSPKGSSRVRRGLCGRGGWVVWTKVGEAKSIPPAVERRVVLSPSISRTRGIGPLGRGHCTLARRRHHRRRPAILPCPRGTTAMLGNGAENGRPERKTPGNYPAYTTPHGLKKGGPQ